VQLATCAVQTQFLLLLLLLLLPSHAGSLQHVAGCSYVLASGSRVESFNAG
jgi:hypothetical protein